MRTSCCCPVLLQQPSRGLAEGLLQRVVPRSPLAPPPLQLGEAALPFAVLLLLRAAAASVCRGIGDANKPGCAHVGKLHGRCRSSRPEPAAWHVAVTNSWAQPCEGRATSRTFRAPASGRSSSVGMQARHARQSSRARPRCVWWARQKAARRTSGLVTQAAALPAGFPARRALTAAVPALAVASRLKVVFQCVARLAAQPPPPQLVGARTLGTPRRVAARRQRRRGAPAALGPAVLLVLLLVLGHAPLALRLQCLQALPLQLSELLRCGWRRTAGADQCTPVAGTTLPHARPCRAALHWRRRSRSTCPTLWPGATAPLPGKRYPRLRPAGQERWQYAAAQPSPPRPNQTRPTQPIPPVSVRSPGLALASNTSSRVSTSKAWSSCVSARLSLQGGTERGRVGQRAGSAHSGASARAPWRGCSRRYGAARGVNSRRRTEVDASGAKQGRTPVRRQQQPQLRACTPRAHRFSPFLRIRPSSALSPSSDLQEEGEAGDAQAGAWGARTRRRQTADNMPFVHPSLGI